MAQRLILSGFDLRPIDVPSDTEVLTAPAPLSALPNFLSQATAALEEPVDGESLPQVFRPHMRVCVVLDDLCYPAPAMQTDCRREMLESVLHLLSSLGAKRDRVHVLVGNGLNRQWRSAELVDVLGPSAGTQPVFCHGAEEFGAHAPIFEREGQPAWELSRHVVEADIVIYLNVVSMPLQAGLSGLVLGTASYRTARMLAAPSLFEHEAPLTLGAPLHQLHEQVGQALQEKTRVFQVSTVLNNDFWDPRWNSLMSFQGEVTRAMTVWNAMPEAVRHRASRLMKSQYRPSAVFGGSPKVVARHALEAFSKQHVVKVRGKTDILVMGLPSVGPHSFGAAQNPVLAAHLGLGLLYNFVTKKPFLKEGGVLILANPLTPSFDKSVHAAYAEFYEQVLRVEKEPEAIHERFEAYYAGRPEYVNSYQKRFAFHGTHPLFSWYQCTAARRRASKIIIAHGDPRACARLGFMPASDVSEALKKAKEFMGLPAPRVTLLQMPPPFFLEAV